VALRNLQICDTPRERPDERVFAPQLPAREGDLVPVGIQRLIPDCHSQRPGDLSSPTPERASEGCRWADVRPSASLWQGIAARFMRLRTALWLTPGSLRRPIPSLCPGNARAIRFLAFLLCPLHCP
jgi:hypothetical protein